MAKTMPELDSVTSIYGQSTGTTFKSDNNDYIDTDGPNRTFMVWSCPPPMINSFQKQMYYSEIASLSIVFICALFGNLCVLLAVWRRRAKSTRMHLFIVHLAVADIMVALFQVFPELMLRLVCGFHAGDVVCRLVKYLQVVGMYGSTYVLVCTAMDRYLAIRYPMRTFKQSKKRVHIAIAMAWLLALILSTPQIFFFGIQEGSIFCAMQNITVTGKRIYVTWYFISVLGFGSFKTILAYEEAFPATLLTFFYGMIAVIIFKNLKRKRQAAVPNRTLIRTNGEFAPRASNIKMVSQAKIKTVKMTFVIVILFAVCYTPFFMFQLLGQWQLINTHSIASQVIHLLASLNSCVNPWVYMGFSGHLLGELKQAFFCQRKKRKNVLPRSFRSTLTSQTANTSLTYTETAQNHQPRDDEHEL